MPTRSVTVGSRIGLHTRPAAIISEAVADLGVEVLIGLPGAAPVDAASALLILTLGAGQGATVEVSSPDPRAVDRVAALVERDLDAQA